MKMSEESHKEYEVFATNCIDFYYSLENELNNVELKTIGMDVSHICFRVATQSEYQSIQIMMKSNSNEFVETQFNGRAVSIFVLKKAIKVSNSHEISVVELPAPRESHTYRTGLEHIGYIVDDLDTFKVEFKSILSGEKIRPFTIPAFIEFENSITAKFYEQALYEIIKLQGFKFETLN